jgi:SAM-dependent methyltransferase
VIDRARVGAIGHGLMPFHNPISESAMDALLALLPVAVGDSVIDVGCGPGELLIRLVEATSVRGYGLDSSEQQIVSGRGAAKIRVPEAELRFEARDAHTLEAPPHSFELAACVGSSHALGGLEPTLERLGELVRHGGYLLLGEGYWIRPPLPAELETLGASEEELSDLPGLLAVGDNHGLRPVYLATATDEDWRRYEWAYVLNLEVFASEHPHEPGIELVHERAEAMRARRLLAVQHGEFLGFALVLWQLPRVVRQNAPVDDEVGAGDPPRTG